MKYICLTAILALFTFQAYTQELNKKVIDEKTGQEILIGYCDENGLKQGEFGQAYETEFNSYQMNMDIMHDLKYQLADVTFTIVLGTWCGDSKEQVGRFMRMLRNMKYDINRLTIIAVDRNKLAGDVDIKNLDITKVPTFIVFRNDQEIGRIVETPIKGLDYDLQAIIKK